MISPGLTCFAYFAAIPLCLVVRFLTRQPGERPLSDFRGTAIPFFAIMAMGTLGEVIYPPRGEWEVARAPALFPLPVTLAAIAVGLVLEALRLGRNPGGSYGSPFRRHGMTFTITAALIIAVFAYVYFNVILNLHF